MAHISSSVLRRWMALVVVLKRAPHSASAAKDITFHMMDDLLRMAPLVRSELFDGLQLRALASDR